MRAVHGHASAVIFETLSKSLGVTNKKLRAAKSIQAYALSFFTTTIRFGVFFPARTRLSGLAPKFLEKNIASKKITPASFSLICWLRGHWPVPGLASAVVFETLSKALGVTNKKLKAAKSIQAYALSFFTTHIRSRFFRGLGPTFWLGAKILEKKNWVQKKNPPRYLLAPGAMGVGRCVHGRASAVIFETSSKSLGITIKKLKAAKSIQMCVPSTFFYDKYSF